MNRRVPRSKRPRPPKNSPPLPSVEAEPEKTPSIALVVAVVLTAILEVIDITIVSVAMPHMLGAFGATSDQITWVLTSYLVAAAVVMPLTGYLSGVFGRKRLLIFAIVGFVVSSALCGLSWNLLSMVIFRIIQGICGAPLVALSQSILLAAFPREKHGQALAIFGMGIMVAPVLGPVLGGWLTDTFVWRAVFYINVPIGVVALLLATGQLATVPMTYAKTDWTGLILLVFAVGSLQLVLDQGPTRDWFDSRFIQLCTLISVFAGAAFLLRGWGKSDNIIDLSLLKDRNFVAGLVASMAYGIPLFGTIALLPLLTQRLMGYPAMSAGLLFMPRAIVSTITLAITGGILLRLFDPRYLVAAGIILSAIGAIVMARISLDVDAWGLIWPGMIAGAGMGLFFVPLNAVAFGRISDARLDEASGLMALVRGIGSSAGIAVVSWLLVHQAQVHWTLLIENINPFNPALVPYLTSSPALPQESSAKILVLGVARQAQMQAFVDLFWFIGWVTFALLPLVFLMKRPERTDLALA